MSTRPDVAPTSEPPGPVAPGLQRALERDPLIGPEALDAEAIGATTPRRKGRFRLWFAVGWLVLIIALAAMANLLPLASVDEIVASAREAPHLSFDEPFGTDIYGRSATSRLIYGARQSLLVGVLAVGIALSVGLLVGIVSGYFHGRWVDEATSIFLDVFLAFPPLVLLLAIASVGRQDILTVGIGLSLIGVPTFARLARAQAIALSERESVLAARAMGAGPRRIMVREILPSVITMLLPYVFIYLGIVMILEGALSFLGLGIPPPDPSWGGMVSDGRAFLQTQPYIAFIPAAFLVLTVLSFTVIGDRVRRWTYVRGSALD